MMNNFHKFKVSLSWEKKQHHAFNNKNVSIKSHTVHISGKPELAISAAKTFKGDPALYNPEDLLLSSLVSCHMMSYHYVCSQHRIEILSYSDSAEAILELYLNGSGRIIEVILNPIVVIADKSQIEKAIALHNDANQICFIANSCNFPVKHFAKCMGEN